MSHFIIDRNKISNNYADIIIEDNTSALSVGEHYHDFFEILYVTKGTVNHCFNGENGILCPGDFMFIDLGDVHSYNRSENSELINLIFLPQVTDSSVDECKNLADLLRKIHFGFENTKNFFYSIPQNIMHDKNREIYHILMSLTSDILLPYETSLFVVRYLIMSLLLKITQPDFCGSETRSLSEITHQLLKLINTNFSDDNLLKNAALSMNYSLPHLSRIFKKEVGVGFKEYLQKYRIDEIKRQLTYSDKKINVIAAECGYNNLKYFNSIFKKHTNLTPSEYRKLSKKI